LADEEVRLRRAELDQEYVTRFAARVRVLFPNCPAGREQVIAAHACQKYSGRVGHSVGTKRLDEEFIRLTVIARVRHTETNCDEILSRRMERWEARDDVQDEIDKVLARWRAE